MGESVSKMVRLPLFLLSVAALAQADDVLKFIRGAQSLYRIQTHNANPNRTYNMTYYHDISAMSPEEFKRKRLGLNMPAVLPDTSDYKANENYKAPDSVDWRNEGIVSPVKNQKDCGSCWAFSATGALEGQHARKKGQLVEFSEQNLIDCSGNYGNSGCGGGLPSKAFEYVKDNGGIDTEDSYPYEDRDDTCRFNKENVGETDAGTRFLPSGDEEALKNAVADIGPISVGIMVTDNFQGYREGVFFDPDCNAKDLDHAVLVVGYGTDKDHGDYWLVKNSWDKKWGEGGYIRMARNRDNNCGIATFAAYPIVN